MTTKFAPSAEAVETMKQSLRRLLPEGSHVYTVLRTISDTGLLRRVSVVVADANTGRVEEITGSVAAVIGWRRDNNGYLPIRGTGFNVATHVVGALSRVLYGDEYSLQSHTL